MTSSNLIGHWLRVAAIGLALPLSAHALTADGSAAQPAQPAATRLPPAPAAALAPGLTRPDFVLVRTRPGATAGQIQALDAAAGAAACTWTSTLVPGLRCVRVAPGTAAAAIAAYRAAAIVMYAEPDHIRSTCAQSTPYGITLVNAPQAWPVSRGLGAIVADLDTGMDLTHPDLPTPALTASFVGTPTVQDGHGHGTHTAGIIAALDNTIGVVGVAPSATLIIGKVLDDTGSGSDDSVAAGIDWAVANHARVISMSLGGTDFSQAMSDSCDAALAAGTLVVAAAGNSNTSSAFYPAQYSSVLSVAAIDSNSQRASFSNFGPTISLSAPGVNVLSTFIGAQADWSGVSHSAQPLTGTGPGSASANAVFCGTGLSSGEFPASVAGNIAHIRRGGDSFEAKTINAIAAGAIGVIISNNSGGVFSGTLTDSFNIPVIAISQTDGDNLQAISGVAATISPTGLHTYATLSGTSMACPHVSGTAALLFSAAPGATPAQVRAAMEATAQDLGDPGRDDLFGFGLVKGDLAIQYLRSHWPCRADFDFSGVRNVADIFVFLSAWFAHDPRADFDGVNGINAADIFAFLSAWFAGC